MKLNTDYLSTFFGIATVTLTALATQSPKLLNNYYFSTAYLGSGAITSLLINKKDIKFDLPKLNTEKAVEGGATPENVAKIKELQDTVASLKTLLESVKRD
jgi:hypothetical protein